MSLKLTMSNSNFDPNAILRGAQLTVVGGLCPLQKIKHRAVDGETMLK